MISPFDIGGVPAVLFGEGSLSRVPGLAASFGKRALLVTGETSTRKSRHWDALVSGFAERDLTWDSLAVRGEPSPRVVDDAVAAFRGTGIDVVVGIGGGSALDAAKAIAGLLPSGRSVMDHLEGVGRGVPYHGPSVPFVAAPTTAGTGTEATKNSVLSERGESGFKRSFRHELLVARYAVVDPSLLETCPPPLVAAEGMDALTQLLESYVSTRANPLTDALAESGLASVRDGLLPWHEGSAQAREARTRMAYASLLSGITLAQVGLGAVHGVASPLGAFFPAPHGVVCGTLVAAAVAANVAAMRARDPGNPALAKYVRAHAILSGRDRSDRHDSPESLAELLEGWTDRLGIPRLGRYGVREEDLPRVVAGCRGGSMKTNPIVLTDEEISRFLIRCL